MLIAVLSLNAQALFEVKDASDHSVFEITDDGIRIFNYPDTLMIISSAEIRANLDNSKGLSRSFSVSVNATGKGGGDVVNIDSDGLRVYNGEDKLMDITGDNITAYIDSNSTKGLSRSFSVSTNATGKAEIDILNVTTETTKMREGTHGNQYTDFSEDNIFIGLNAGMSIEPDLLNGTNNVFIGNEAGLLNNTGWRNVFIGQEAGNSNTSGFSGVFIGYQAGFSNLSAFSNIFVGSSSGYSNTTGYNNIFIGASAGSANTEGMSNIFIGSGAGKSTIGDVSFEGYNNLFLGNSSGYENITGATNVYVGNGSGFSMTSGKSNVFIGTDVGRSKTGGDDNVMVGYRSGYSNTSGEGNVFLGYQTGYYETGSDKLYIDNRSTSTPLIYGEFDNNFLQINGELNVVGGSTLGSLMIAPSETTSGDDAEIVLAEDNDGTYNMSMKYDGGLNRLEWWAEQSGTNYGPLMYLGYNTIGGGVGYLSTGFIRPMSNDTFDLGSSTLRWDDIYATNGVIQTSDKRQKSSIKDMEYGLNTILKMRPVTYFWKDKPERGRKVGLIAQEVIDLIPEIVNIGDDKDKTMGLNYAELTPILIKALQEQQEEIESFKKENKKLNNRLNEIEELLRKLNK